jgi:Holliday junction resolvasome RuvABC endonuclease subunit
MFAGVDLGGTTGFAVLGRDGERIHSIAIKLGTRTGKSLYRLYDDLKTELLVYGVTEVGYEQVRQQHKSRIAACAYGSYEGMLMLTCAELLLPLHPFFPHEVKKAAAGFVQAEKDDMEAMALKKWNVLVSTHDEADALFIAELTRRKVLGL